MGWRSSSLSGCELAALTPPVLRASVLCREQEGAHLCTRVLKCGRTLGSGFICFCHFPHEEVVSPGRRGVHVPSDSECLGGPVGAACSPEPRPAGRSLLAALLHVCTSGLLRGTRQGPHVCSVPVSGR